MPTTVSNGTSIGARLWIPSFRYVGAELNYRGVSYSVDPQPLCAGLGRPCAGAAPVGDFVSDLRVLGLARYYFDAGSSTFHVGARLGYDGQSIRKWSVANNAINPENGWVSGLGVGAELGAEIGSKVNLGAAFTEGLAGGGTPSSTQLNIDFGYTIVPHLFLGLGYELNVRSFDLESNDQPVAQIADRMHAGSLSVGVEF